MKNYYLNFPFLLLLFCLPHSIKGQELPSLERVEEQIATLQASQLDEEDQTLELWKNLHAALSNIALEHDSVLSLENRLSQGAEINKIDFLQLKNPASHINPDYLNNQETINLTDEISLRITLAEGLKTGLLKQINDAEDSINNLPQELASLNSQINEPDDNPIVDSTSTAPSNQLTLARQQLSELKLKKLRLSLEYNKLALPQLNEELVTLNKALLDLTSTQKTLLQAVATIKSSEAQQVQIFTKPLIPLLKVDSDAHSLAKINLQTATSAIENNSAVSLTKLEQLISSCEESLTSITQQSNNAKERLRLLEKAGMPVDRATGKLLRRQRANLPSPSQLRKGLNLALQQNTELQIALLEHKQQLGFYPDDPETWARNYLTKYPSSQVTAESLTKLATIGKSSLKQIIQDQETLAHQQGSYIASLERTITASSNYSSFLDAKLLWIASHAPLSFTEISDEFKAIAALFSYDNSKNWLIHLRLDISDAWVFWVTGFFVITALLVLRPKLSKVLQTLDEQVQDRHCASISPTSFAIVLDTILAAPIPLLFYFIAWRSYADPSYQAGFLAAGNFAIFTFLIHRFARTQGIFQAHFRLPKSICSVFQKNTKHLLFIALPAYALANILITADIQDYAAGRLLLVLFLPLLSIHFHLLSTAYKRSMPSKDNLTPGLFYFFSSIVPLFIALTAIVGYYTSALTLLTSYIQTLRIGIIIILIYLILRRWLIISRRRIALKSAKEALSNDITEEQSISRKELIRQELEGITEGSEQSRRLLSASAATILSLGLLAIWSNTFPALNALDDVSLWQTTELTESAESNTSNSPIASIAQEVKEKSTTSDIGGASESEKNYISLQDLLLSIITLILTYFCATNIPGLLRLTILDRLNLKTGAAFGLTTIVRYTLITIGIILAFHSIGITWGKVQWLAAAITLGIGFGLQEIFANFVSGLIILFERPIRIGDMVTVGDINGRVHKIQMRSTTILQFNNRELIVPNKEFITTQLVNWTLTTNLMRTKVCVGIAYGSDTKLATKLLLQCAADNERALNEPSPSVIFRAFGASSLDFELRVFINSVDNLIPVQSELHYAIDEAFRNAGIEIAFPQQDVHIKEPINFSPDPVTRDFSPNQPILPQ